MTNSWRLPFLVACLKEKQQPLEIYGFPLYQGGNFSKVDKWAEIIKLNQYGLSRKKRKITYSPNEGIILY